MEKTMSEDQKNGKEEQNKAMIHQYFELAIYHL